MPLSTFLKILPSKSPVHARQSPSNSLSQSPKASKRLKTQSVHLGHKNVGSTSSSSKTKESRAFTFPFGQLSVFGSLRGRRKPEMAGPLSGSKNSPMYSGYDDEEYGGPQAEAEEIRRPSGLGRRASIGEAVVMTGQDHPYKHRDRGKLSPDIRDEDSVTVQESNDGPRASEDSYNESLVEIRYPSGLGNFKPVLNIFSTDNPLSTYPVFEELKSYDSCHRVSLSNSALSPPNKSALRLSDLAAVIPFLAPFLSRGTLFSLSLVSRAVAEPSRQLLWRVVSLEVTLPSLRKREMDVASHSRNLLDILSTRHDLACLVKSLDFSCLHTAPHISPRPRPPPLILVPSLPISSRGSTHGVPATFCNAPLILESDYDPSNGQNSPVESLECEEKERSLSKLRRVSSFFPSRLSLKTKLPEIWQSPQSKLSPPSIQLPHSLSPNRRRSFAFIRPKTASPLPGSPSPTASNADPEISYPPKYPSGQSTWIPPSEWDWVSSAHSRRHSVQSPVQSSPHSHPPSAGWSPSHYIYSKLPAQYPREHQLNSKSSSPSLNMDPHATGSPKLSPELRTSLSLPSFHPYGSPATSGPRLFRTPEDHSLSPATTPITPVTPYSAVSLSAFPLPPQSSTPLCVPPFPTKFSPPSLQDKRFHLPSPLLFGPTPVMNEGLEQKLLSASANLTHITNVTLLFAQHPNPASSDPVPDNLRPHPEKPARTVENLDVGTIKILKVFLQKLKSLRRVKVVCAAEEEAFHHAQWSTLRDSLHNLEIVVMCTP